MLVLAYTSVLGRRINLVVSSWLTFVVIVMMVFTHNLYARYVGMFLLGVLMIMKIVAYVVATELAPFKHQMVVAMFLLSYDSLTYVGTSVYFEFINDNWRYLAYFYVVCTFLI